MPKGVADSEWLVDMLVRVAGKVLHLGRLLASSLPGSSRETGGVLFIVRFNAIDVFHHIAQHARDVSVIILRRHHLQQDRVEVLIHDGVLDIIVIVMIVEGEYHQRVINIVRIDVEPVVAVLICLQLGGIGIPHSNDLAVGIHLFQIILADVCQFVDHHEVNVGFRRVDHIAHGPLEGLHQIFVQAGGQVCLA